MYLRITDYGFRITGFLFGGAMLEEIKAKLSDISVKLDQLRGYL